MIFGIDTYFSRLAIIVDEGTRLTCGESDFVLRNHLSCMDCIVPFCETMAFSLTWNVMDLIERMSRIIDII